jgi:hypothetical protein
LLVWLSFQSFGLIDGWFKASSNSGIKVPFFLFAEKLSGLLFTPFQPHHAKVRPKTTWLSHKLIVLHGKKRAKNIPKTRQGLFGIYHFFGCSERPTFRISYFEG